MWIEGCFDVLRWVGCLFGVMGIYFVCFVWFSESVAERILRGFGFVLADLMACPWFTLGKVRLIFDRVAKSFPINVGRNRKMTVLVIFLLAAIVCYT
jgi:hypothetical protein